MAVETPWLSKVISINLDYKVTSRYYVRLSFIFGLEAHLSAKVSLPKSDLLYISISKCISNGAHFNTCSNLPQCLHMFACLTFSFT